jgi:hypothetical protein
MLLEIRSLIGLLVFWIIMIMKNLFHGKNLLIIERIVWNVSMFMSVNGDDCDHGCVHVSYGHGHVSDYDRGRDRDHDVNDYVIFIIF